MAGLFIAVAVWGAGFGGGIVMVCNIGIAPGATVGGVLVDGVSASAPLLAGGTAAITGAAVLVTARTT